jgi:hypothetical protein
LSEINWDQVIRSAWSPTSRIAAISLIWSKLIIVSDEQSPRHEARAALAAVNALDPNTFSKQAKAVLAEGTSNVFPDDLRLPTLSDAVVRNRGDFIRN